MNDYVAVVRSKEDGCRGVIIGWEKIDDLENNDDSTQGATSLTKKSYQLDAADRVKYTIAMDIGDAHLRNARQRYVRDIGISEVLQTNLELVEDERCV